MSVRSHDILVANNLGIYPDNNFHVNDMFTLQSGDNVVYDHNTLIGPYGFVKCNASETINPTTGFQVTNNIIRPYQSSVPCIASGSATVCWSGSTGHHNLIVNNYLIPQEKIDSFYNLFGNNPGWTETGTSGLNAIGFTNYGTDLDIWDSPAFNWRGTNFQLLATSPYHAGNSRQASDGKDVGVDFAQLNEAIFGSGTPPPAPTNLQLTDIDSPLGIRLNWTDNSSTETGFIIGRCTGASCTPTQFATVGANVSTYTDNTVAEHTLYRYNVLAFNAFGNSAPTSTVGLTSLWNAPTSLVLKIISSSRIDVYWTSNATSFSIEDCAGAGCTNFVEVATPSSSPQSLTGLTPSTIYRVRLRAVSAEGYSAYSSIQSGTTLP